jgi:hypothetical protein
VFVGSAGGVVYSLSAATGCVHWFFETGAPMRAAISVARIKTATGMRYAALFGDGAANAYAHHIVPTPWVIFRAMNELNRLTAEGRIKRITRSMPQGSEVHLYYRQRNEQDA